MPRRLDSIHDETMFAQLFEAAPDGELVVAEDGRVRLANANAHRILGWPRGTLIGRLLDELLAEPPHATAGFSIAYQWDGMKIPVETTVTNVNAGSEPLRYVTLRDLSARLQEEQKLRDSEETFRLLVDGVRDYAIFFLDPEGNVVTWNGGAERIKGYRADEIIGRSHERFYLPQDLAAGVPSELLRRAAEQGDATDEGVRVRKDGSRFLAFVTLTALHDGSGRLRGFAKVTRDITEQRHAEQSVAILADASRRLAESLEAEQILSTITRMAVPSFADAVLIHLRDPQGVPHLGMFHAAEPEILAALEEMQRAGTFRVAAPSRRVMRTGRSELHPRLTPEHLRAEEVDEDLGFLIRRFGISSSMHVAIVSANRPSAVVVFAAAGTRVYNERDLVFAEELTRRASTAMHNAELLETAETLRARAEEASALRERLVAIVGHDLRNPLASISMGAQMLSERALAAADARLVIRIQRSVNRMTRMIGQILDFARIRSGQSFELDLEPADMHLLCHAVVDEVRLGHPEREIRLNVEGRADARFDADRIAQVLSNLIGNAVQHGTGGPITVTVRDAIPDAVAVEVHNVGPPIPEAKRAALFEAFHRDSTAGDRRSSLGLGLFIAGQIVSAHGGSITVRSPDRNGTTFRIVLPRDPADAAPARPQLH